MSGMVRSSLILAVGGDVLTKYGTFSRRYQSPLRGGEEAALRCVRAGVGGTSINFYNQSQPVPANIPRLHWAIDPISGTLRAYLLAEGGATNLVENSDCEADVVGWEQVASTLTRDSAFAFNGAWAAKVVTTNTDSGFGITKRNAARMAATVGQGYTFSVWIYGTGTAVGKPCILYINWFNGGAFLSNVSQATGGLLAGWNRYRVSGIAPASTTVAEPYFESQGAQGVFTFWADLPQFEATSANVALPTSAIVTGTAAVTRAGDDLRIPLPTTGPFWIYSRHLELGSGIRAGSGGGWAIGDGNNAYNFFGSSLNNGWAFELWNGGNQGSGAPTPVPGYGQIVETFIDVNPAGFVTHMQSIQGAAPTQTGPTAVGVPNILGPPMELKIGLDRNGNPGYAVGFSRILVGQSTPRTVVSLTDARAVEI